MTETTLACLGSFLEFLHTLFDFLICFVKMMETEDFSSAENVSRQTSLLALADHASDPFLSN